MPNRYQTRAALLGHLPEHQRSRILSGMRWTVWLSAIAVPSSLAINFLLARVDPETLGVYGLLGVYVGLTSAFLYFGGDTVVMRFIPECSPEDRTSFLVSYLFVILGVVSCWLVFAWFCPAAMRLALGKTGGDRFHFLVLCLAVVPIGFAMIVACLKGMLEIRVAQVLAKSLRIISLAIYAILFVFDRSLLSTHPTAIIWSVYLGISAILAAIGAVRLAKLCRTPRLHWFLPEGFWRYSFSTQQVSLTSFFSMRLDYIFIANFGGLRLLGKYVAIMAIAEIVPMVGGFFMDTLLPSLTNTITARNHDGAAQVFTMHMRILFLVMTAASCAVMLLAVPATVILGSKYASLGELIILMALCFGIASPGGIGGTILASIGRQQLVVWTNVLKLCLFACLFLLLWRRWGLTGAVIANGSAMVITSVVLMVIALRTAGIFPAIYGLWIRAGAVQMMVGFLAWWCMPIGIVTAALLWLGAMVLFFWLSGYGLAECQGLLQTFFPVFTVDSHPTLILLSRHLRSRTVLPGESTARKREDMIARRYSNRAGMEFIDPGFRRIGRLALRAVFTAPAGLRNTLLFENSVTCLLLQKSIVALLGGKFQVQTRFTEGPMRGRNFLCWSSEKYFMLGSHYERDAQQILMETVRPADTVYDIGGHAGYMALLFSALVGPTGTVFTFEPSPITFPRLQRNVEANEPSNITAVNVAASDHEGEALIDDRSSESAIVGTTTGNCDRLSQVQTIRLDDFAFRDGNPPPTFIKIDIEGHAGPALEGMRNILESAHPKIICELHNTNEAQQVTRILDGYRYRFRPIDRVDTFPRRVLILPT